MPDTDTNLQISPHRTKLPDGVTVDDAKRITELAEEDRRPLTHRTYTSK